MNKKTKSAKIRMIIYIIILLAITGLQTVVKNSYDYARTVIYVGQIVDYKALGKYEKFYRNVESITSNSRTVMIILLAITILIGLIRILVAVKNGTDKKFLIINHALIAVIIFTVCRTVPYLYQNSKNTRISNCWCGTDYVKVEKDTDVMYFHDGNKTQNNQEG